VLKISIGLIAGSLAVVADGIDSAGDIIASVITLFTAYLVRKPPDLKYAYGYERADTVAAKILAFIIFFAGAQLAISTVQRLMAGATREIPEMAAIYVTIASIFGKVLLAWYQRRIGKKIGSLMLQTNARNMLNDVIISLAVLVGLLFTFVLKMPILDTITALLVSFWIMYVAVRIFRESSLELMDGMKDASVYERVFKAIAKVQGASHPHRAKIRKIGHKYAVAVDIEIDGDLPLKQAHSLAHQVEEEIRMELVDVCDIVVHTEPVGDATEEEFGISEDDLKNEKSSD
jgi:cation diffusion facilitator family transporter